MTFAGPAAPVRAIRRATVPRHSTDAEPRATSRATRLLPLPFMRLALGLAMLATVASATMATAPVASAADPRVADFTTSATSGPPPLTVAFTATSTGEPTSWTWDFGDGGSAATPSASHAYPDVGTFTIRLTVTYDDHPPVVVTKADLIVVAVPPVALTARIGWTGLGVVAGQPVTFVDSSIGDPTSWAWDFGDGTTASEATPAHTYAAAGSFTVTLKVGKGSNHDTATAVISVIEAWTGAVQLYAKGVYSPQRTLRWCTAASTQMIRNMITGERDRSSHMQRVYYVYGRAHNAFKTPGAAGVDPAGWQAILRNWVDPAYRIVAPTSYVTALKAAVRAMRLTGRPVAVLVGYGSHAWVLSGFTASADPALTNAFTVMSVNVEGPLHGRPVIRGFDPVPNITLSPTRFHRFFTPFRDKYEPKAWRDRYVVIVP